MDIYFWIDSTILTYFLIMNGFLTLSLICSIVVMHRQHKESAMVDISYLSDPSLLPPITTIITTYNEENTILDATHAALNVDYPSAFVIVMINGSNDKTLELLKESYRLQPVPPAVPLEIKVSEVKGYYRSETHPKLLVMDKDAASKGDATSAAINASTTPFYVAIDGDTFLEKNVFRNMARTLLTKDHIVALAGCLRVADGSTFEKGSVKKIELSNNFLVIMQTLEYLRAFLCGRPGWNILGGSYIISGALGLFNKEIVKEVGGYNRFFGEDMDITLRLYKRNAHKKPKGHIYQAFDAVAWTNVPTNAKWLGKQRKRWQIVLFDAVKKHSVMLFNPKYAPVGILQIPYLLFLEGIGAIVEGFGYFYIIFSLFHHIFSPAFFIQFLLLAWGYTILLSLISVTLQGFFWKQFSRTRDILKIILYSIIEIFGYRQMTVWWRICGTFNFLFKKKHTW